MPNSIADSASASNTFPSTTGSDDAQAAEALYDAADEACLTDTCEEGEDVALASEPFDDVDEKADAPSWYFDTDAAQSTAADVSPAGAGIAAAAAAASQNLAEAEANANAANNADGSNASTNAAKANQTTTPLSRKALRAQKRAERVGAASVTVRVAYLAVFALNILCAVQFITQPENFAASYELSGVAGNVALQGLGVAFLMWNVTYPAFIISPKRFKSLGLIILLQQAVGLAGESWILQNLVTGHAALAGSIQRFIIFDAIGLVVMAATYLWFMIIYGWHRWHEERQAYKSIELRSAARAASASAALEKAPAGGLFGRIVSKFKRK